MKPTLLLLAGMLNDERVWEPVAQRLAKEKMLINYSYLINYI